MRPGKIFFGVVRISISMGVLFLLFRQIPLTDIVGTIINAKGWYVLVALFLYLPIQLILAFRLKLITDKQGMNISTAELLKINLSAAFYGLFMPGGNVTRAAVGFYKISRSENKWSEGFASIAIDRLLATITLCLVGFVFLIIDVPSDSESLILRMTALLVLLLIVSFLVFSQRNPLSLNDGIIFINRYLLRRKNRQISGSLNPYNTPPPGTIAYAAVISLCAHLLGVLLFTVLAISTGVHIPFVTLGWIRSAVILITMIPISISGLGVREGMMLYVLKPYGVTGEEALAISFLLYGITLLLPGTIGAFIEGRNFLSARSG